MGELERSDWGLNGFGLGADSSLSLEVFGGEGGGFRRPGSADVSSFHYNNTEQMMR